MTSHEFDRAIDALARKQHGAFSQTQAKQCGGSDRMIRYRKVTFERDRARDHQAQMHGFEVTRFSYAQLIRCPEYVLEVLLTIGQRDAA